MAKTIAKKIIAAVVVILLDDNGKEIKKKKSKWCKTWLLQRRIYTHMNLLRELHRSEPADIKNYLRMDSDAFNILLELVRPKITKQNTQMREAITPEERLTVTLRYLATGNSYEDLKFSTAISPQSIGQIIPETCWAIYEVLKEEYLKLTWIFLIVEVHCHSGCSAAYGSEPCAFLPSPPGKTPSCAHHGLTYCEHPDHYPGQLIHFLIQKWRFDHSTIISSESREDFSSFFYPPPSSTYGPPNYHSFGPPAFNPTNYPEPIHIPKPQYPFQDYADTYIPPIVYPVQNVSGYPDRRQQRRGHQLNFNFPQENRQQYQPQSYYGSADEPQYGPYNNHIWRRRVENNYQRLKRSLEYKRSQQTILKHLEDGNSNSTSPRSKRQSTSGAETLCRFRSLYVMPRAALNNKGNWMYVVNMPEVDNQYTQLVKSETCVSQTCNGVCSLPQGYSSRCEQKYIQKRLVALEGGGNQLYTDLFWIPSCCVCTISNE